MERNSIENDSILCFQFVILVAARFEIKAICNQARNEAEKIINSIITSFFFWRKSPYLYIRTPDFIHTKLR